MFIFQVYVQIVFNNFNIDVHHFVAGMIELHLSAFSHFYTFK